MDGNGRWARNCGLPRSEGHRRGVEVAKEIVRAVVLRNIGHLTLFAFSTENWSRPRDEVVLLFKLMADGIRDSLDKLCENGIRVTFLGDLAALPVWLRDVTGKIVRQTASNSRLRLQIALNYSGRWDIVDAVRKLASAGTGLSGVTEAQIDGALSTAGLPDPDLIIRTSGEQRISNFMLWQSAYTELYFCKAHWPDFDEVCLDAALEDYAGRERRYGRVEQFVERERERRAG